MHQEYIPFELVEGKVYYNNEECPHGYDENSGKIRISFRKTRYDNPKIDGLILFEGKLEDTDYYEQNEIK